MLDGAPIEEPFSILSASIEHPLEGRGKFEEWVTACNADAIEKVKENRPTGWSVGRRETGNVIALLMNGAR